MVAAIGRRIVRLEDGDVTIGPWSMAELDAFGAALDLPTQLEIFAGHIESHPWDVDDPLDLDAVTLAETSLGAGPSRSGRVRPFGGGGIDP